MERKREMEFAGIEHRTVEVNGIKMHIAEKGEGPVVLFLHGFPELWYSWRHQIQFLAARGYRAVAPDLRGYGDTEAPPDIAAYSIFHLVGDIVALIDSLGQDQVFVVGHDWGALVAWHLCAFRPDKVKALVNLSVVYIPRNPAAKPVDGLRAAYGNDLYISRFQEPGEVEAQFAQVETPLLMKILLTSFSPQPLLIPEKGFPGRVGEEITLPSWLSEDDIDYFASKFSKTGFTGGINYYRNLNSGLRTFVGRQPPPSAQLSPSTTVIDHHRWSSPSTTVGGHHRRPSSPVIVVNHRRRSSLPTTVSSRRRRPPSLIVSTDHRRRPPPSIIIVINHHHRSSPPTTVASRHRRPSSAISAGHHHRRLSPSVSDLHCSSSSTTTNNCYNLTTAA